jgi:membrane fusion protein (multidrug efflux system)
MRAQYFYLIVIFLTLLAGCDHYPPSPKTPAPEWVRVSTSVIEAGQWQRKFSSFGQVVPADEYEISVDVSAVVKQVLFDEGQQINMGDTLLVLDDSKLRLLVTSAEAGVADAKAQLHQAQTTHDKNISVFAKGAISEQAYLQSEANLKSAAANVQRAAAGLSIARQDLGDTQVVSPVAGVVKRRSIEPGKNVGPASSLGLIRSENLLRVETFVSQKDYAAGARNGVYLGLIESIAGAAEPATGNFKIRVSVNNSDGLLRDGMAAKVTFDSIAAQDVVAIPRAAVVDRNRKLIVFIVKDDAAQAIEPVLGVGSGDHYPVVSGLAAGDEVIVSNLRLITNGQLIQRIPL